MKSLTMRSLVLAVACAALLVAAVSGAAAPVKALKAGPAGKKLKTEGSPAVQDGATVYLAVAMGSSHVRLLIENPDATIVTIHETTTIESNGKVVQDSFEVFGKEKASWSNSMQFKEVGKTTRAKFDIMLASLSKEDFPHYSYQTNTCGVAALRMLYYLGIDPLPHLEWLAQRMHDLEYRPKGVISGHTLRVYFALGRQNPDMDKATADKGADELWQSVKPVKEDDVKIKQAKKEQIATIIAKVKQYAIEGMKKSLRLAGLDIKEKADADAAAAGAHAATGAPAAAVGAPAAKKFLFRQRLQNPKLHVV